MLKQQKLDCREQWLDSDRKIRNDDVRICLEIKNLNEISRRRGRGKWEVHVKQMEDNRIKKLITKYKPLEEEYSVGRE